MLAVPDSLKQQLRLAACSSRRCGRLSLLGPEKEAAGVKDRGSPEGESVEVKTTGKLSSRPAVRQTSVPPSRRLILSTRIDLSFHLHSL